MRGDFRIHDLDVLSAYCVGWDLKALLRDGFRGVEGKVESRPPEHLRSALGQVVNFFYTLQGEAAGAQALTNFDTLLAPFVRYDGLDEREVKQALQEFAFNVNVPTRVGFQPPFTNIALDLEVPSTLRDQRVIFGGTLAMTEENEAAIQKLMRHKSIASTLVYTKFSNAYLMAVSERINYGPHRIK